MNDVNLDVTFCKVPFNGRESQKLATFFKRKVKQNVRDFQTQETNTFVAGCVENAYHCVLAQQHLGKYKKVDRIDCGISCPFCFNPFKEKEFKRTLPCGHQFHKKCIDKWIFRYNNATCPCCRTMIY